MSYKSLNNPHQVARFVEFLSENKRKTSEYYGFPEILQTCCLFVCQGLRMFKNDKTIAFARTMIQLINTNTFSVEDL